ncbi:MAG: hypothetical protein EPO52_04540 [Herbiconiux sp.]|uniref:hypothetical protein n=1 Tax=Herbiconiux sp. TaxID=1871186 RepID=UPI0012114EA7|nr:hypothetical protein [Herbiconiux sp.]TAJ49541.1 MAG: hypothetical protein EPO52_04540 [Herbiconiux sp.]
MSPTPRVVFWSFASASDPMRESWNRFRDAVVTTATAPKIVSADPAGIWRLLAVNNRELGRSAHLYPDPAAARAHIVRLRARLDELVITPVSGPKPGSRGWYMTLDNRIVLTCGRWYGAAASSSEAAAACRDALAIASFDVPDASVPPAVASIPATPVHTPVATVTVIAGRVVAQATPLTTPVSPRAARWR